MRGLDDLAYLDATAQAELVRKKKIKPIELVEAAIERIESLNPTLNAVVTPLYEYARQKALGPIPEGPFSGVPFLLKDFLAEFAGVRFGDEASLIALPSGPRHSIYPFMLNQVKKGKRGKGRWRYREE